MSTIYVWTLVFYMVTGGNVMKSGGPAVVDNIASQEECQRIAALLFEREHRGTVFARCIQVQKVKQ